MQEKEFDLLQEPWIRVVRDDCRVEELSLPEALIRAHEYRGLSGELPAQDAAVMRLLLAVLHAVFENVNVNGEKAKIESEEAALDCWEGLWKNCRFPEEPLTSYFETQKENFWLFHPERPFWQIPAAKKGTEYEASKLNGVLSESSNKVRLFPERTGAEKKRLTFPEAARWLLYVNAYDDTSAKPTKEGKADRDGKMPSPGAGWLGKIGYVCVCGNNLFETLMLNLVLLDEKGQPWTSAIPAWELKIPRVEERIEIPVPHDQAELLTLQSRRLLLQRDENYVTGFYLLGGDFFAKENAFAEQMTVWSQIRDKKGNVTGYQPKRHNKARKMWRDFSSYLPTNNNIPLPGVIRWNSELQRSQILPTERVLRLSITSVQYGDKDFFVADMFSDSLSLHLNLLSDLGGAYRQRIADMVSRCYQTALYLGNLASDLFLAAGGDREKKNAESDNAKEKYYYEIDVPFRKWLASLDAEDTSEQRESKIMEWCAKSDEIAMNHAERLVRNSGKPAFIGKLISDDKDRKKYCCSSQAMRDFTTKMKNLNKV